MEGTKQYEIGNKLLIIIIIIIIRETLYLDIAMLILDPGIHGVVVAGEGGKVGVHKPEDDGRCGKV